MFCKFCGAAIDEDSTFCAKCGGRVVSQQAASIEAQRRAQTQSLVEPSQLGHASKQTQLASSVADLKPPQIRHWTFMATCSRVAEILGAINRSLS
jgi:zinc-ribbon domain